MALLVALPNSGLEPAFHTRHTVSAGASIVLLSLMLSSCAEQTAHVDMAANQQKHSETVSADESKSRHVPGVHTLALEEIVVPQTADSAVMHTVAKARKQNKPQTGNPGDGAMPLREDPKIKRFLKGVSQGGYSGASAVPFTRKFLTAPYRESYLAFEQNAIELVSEKPVSTFSIDVDTAAYSNVRRILQRDGRLPPHHAVKIEEMINYFDYNYPQPESNRPFSVTTELAQSPWHSERQLLHIGIQGVKPAPKQRPAANLVFLVDVSGSMQSSDKLGLVKKSLRLLTNTLNANDRIALVVYAGAAGLVLDSTPASKRSTIMQAIEGLTAGGSTNGGDGIRLAYAQAKEHFIEGGINRVLVASDGDLNVGTVDLTALKELVSEQRKTGISLTTLGFGTGNTNYALMEQLADHGNGNAAYIDSLQEAQKVLVQQINSTLHTIASDVKIQIEFNPALVSEYRLIGYENRVLKREDFRNDKVDAGEIGAGHSVTALYEITPANSQIQSVAPLRYQAGEIQIAIDKRAVADKTAEDDMKSELAYVRLRYKSPGKSSSVELAQAIAGHITPPSLANASENLRFAASVAGFGGLLTGGRYTSQWSYPDALQLARSARGDDPHGYRGEFLRLVELAHSLTAAMPAERGDG